MFILYAIPIGIVVGLLAGGRLEGFGELRFRWAALAFAGLTVQVVLFWGPVASALGTVAPAVYLASTIAVLAAVLRNASLPGLKAVALGAALNLVAILANGGCMPATPEALAAAGLEPTSGFSNSCVTRNPALGPLTDVFALPSWLPFANVFSVGDVLIGVGIVVAVAGAMRRRPEREPPATSPVPSGNSPD